jgi:hypothetical protein
VRGRGRGSVGGAPVQDEDHTDRKVEFTLYMPLWPDYVHLSDRIHKNKLLTMFNRIPPPDAMKYGKIVSVVVKRGTLAHKNKYKVSFEYSSSSRFL